MPQPDILAEASQMADLMHTEIPGIYCLLCQDNIIIVWLDQGVIPHACAVFVSHIDVQAIYLIC